MQTLSPQDASFLNVETPSTHMHVTSVGIYEGPALASETIAAAIAGKLPLIPRYRQKVRFVPLELGRPVWVDDPEFDLGYHLRYTALPSPGSDEELRNLVGRLIGQPLDRSRPLWEMWVVQGLAGGRWALITKTHHCMVDGVSSTDLMSVVLDADPEPSSPPAERWQPEPEPDDAHLIANALKQNALQPYDTGRRLLAAAREPARMFGDWLHLGRGLAALEPVLHQAPSSSLNGPIGPQRRWSCVRGSLADAKTIRAALGGTLNDVFLAVITNGFRALLTERGEDVQKTVVRTLVPVSLRTAGDRGAVDNRVSALYAELPIGLDDPRERLQSVRDEMERLKQSGQSEGSEAITALGAFTPSALLALGGQLAAGIPQRNLQTVTTNVPGPRHTLYLAGRRLLEIYPVVPLGGSVRIGIAIMTYAGNVNYGVTGDYDSTRDIEVLCRGIEDGAAELLEAAK